MSHSKTDQSKALLELWEIVSRFRWRFLVLVFVMTTLVLSVSLFIPRKYQAEAVFERSVDLVLSEITSRGGSRPMQVPRASLNKEVAGEVAVSELLSQLEPELRERGFITSEHDLQDLRRHLLRHVVTHWDVSSQTIDRIRLSYVGDDPELASLLLNGLIENYILRTRVAMAQRLTQSAAFFKGKADDSQAHIDTLQDQLLQFEIENSRLLPEVSASVQVRLSELESELMEVIANRDAAGIRAEALAASLAQTPAQRPTVVTSPNPERHAIREQLRQLREREREASTTLKMTDRHPDLVDLRMQIETMQAQLEQTDAEVVTERQLADNPKHAELELQLTQAHSEHEALDRRVTAMQEQLAAMSSSPQELFTTRSRYQALNRQVDEAQRQLTFWEDNLRRVEMALAAEHGGHAVQLDFVHPAVASRRPVSPNLMQVLMAATVLGLLTGGLGVFLAYRTDGTFSDTQELAAACNLPLVGSVSELITRKHRRLRRLRSFVIYPANAVAMGGVVVALTVALYLDLERPGTLAQFKQTAASALLRPAAAQASDPGATRSDARADDVAPDTDEAHERMTEFSSVDTQALE